MPGHEPLKRGYDLVVIGAGVHGAAVALEATRRGYAVLVLEQGDFCSGVSANSLKIIHGGLRYLQSADFRRSRESAREQQALMGLAPHLVKPLPCLIATERSLTGGRTALSLGIRFYDRVVCARLGERPRGRILPVEEANRLAGLEAFAGGTGAALWYDGRAVDTERLVVSCLKTAERAGAHLRSYTAVTGVERGAAPAVRYRDTESGETGRVAAGRIIDTAGFTRCHSAWCRGVNLVVNRAFGEHAFGRKLSPPSPDAGRLFFGVPFRGRTIIGTWYFPDRAEGSVRLSESEYRRCINDLRDLLPGAAVDESDVSLVHIGRLPVADAARPLSLLERPVIAAVDNDERVIGVTGVKYTTARPTAARALDRAGLKARGPVGPIPSFYGTPTSMPALEREVAGCLEKAVEPERRPAVVARLCAQYGSVAADIAGLAASSHGFECIPGEDALRAEIDYGVEVEHCRTLADFMLRRSGIGSGGRPGDETVRYCAAAMGERLDWPAARVAAEIKNLDRRYQRFEADL